MQMRTHAEHMLSLAEHRRGAGGRTRPPLRSLRELAEDRGMTIYRLAAYLRNSPSAPKAQLRHHDNTWYEPHAFNRWWDSRTPVNNKEEK